MLSSFIIGNLNAKKLENELSMLVSKCIFFFFDNHALVLHITYFHSSGFDLHHFASCSLLYFGSN